MVDMRYSNYDLSFLYYSSDGIEFQNKACLLCTFDMCRQIESWPRVDL